MRTADELRTQLLILRDKKRIDSTKIAEDSRCSRAQVMQALAMKASEDVHRKLDAYLDATHLHVQERNSVIMTKIELLDQEMFHQLGLKNLHPLTVQGFSPDSKKRHLAAMHMRAKKVLCEKLEKEHKLKFTFPDALDYWECKQRACQRLGITYRGPRTRLRTTHIPQNRRLQPR